MGAFNANDGMATFNTGYVYRFTRNSFSYIDLPSTAIGEDFPPVAYELVVALRPRSGQSAPAMSLMVEDVVMRALLSKTEDHDFSASIKY
ncbi:hypothetical protein ACT691_06800 [Vibrio metschnikovii]